MLLWRISQESNSGYDTYDSAVVAAGTKKQAQRICPDIYRSFDDEGDLCDRQGLVSAGSWAPKLADVKVEYLGVAKAGTKAGVIVASFNAG